MVEADIKFDRGHLTQVKRALDHLGAELIAAIPQRPAAAASE
jgi:hypothetical protein